MPSCLFDGYFRVTLDMVAWSQEEKCGLKYEMFSQYQKLNEAECPVRLREVIPAFNVIRTTLNLQVDLD